MAQFSKSTPSHVVYQVRDRKDEKGVWTRIGAAWPHSDGEGFNVQLSAFPIGGKLVIRKLVLDGEQA